MLSAAHASSTAGPVPPASAAGASSPPVGLRGPSPGAGCAGAAAAPAWSCHPPLRPDRGQRRGARRWGHLRRDLAHDVRRDRSPAGRGHSGEAAEVLPARHDLSAPRGAGLAMRVCCVIARQAASRAARRRQCGNRRAPPKRASRTRGSFWTASRNSCSAACLRLRSASSRSPVSACVWLRVAMSHGRGCSCPIWPKSEAIVDRGHLP